MSPNLRINLAALILCLAIVGTPAKAAIIEITGASDPNINGEWDITFVEGSFGNVEPVLKDQVWWGSSSLASKFAMTLSNAMGSPNSPFGPYFAYCGGIQVCVWASSSSGTQNFFPLVGNNVLTWATADPVSKTLGSPTQLANVFTAWKNAISWGKDNSTENKWDKLSACVDDPSCDIDQAYADEQSVMQEGKEILTDTAIKTGELNFDAVWVPTNKAEAIVFGIKKGLDFLVNIFSGDDDGASVSDSSVNATEGTFSINPDFAFYDGFVDLWLNDYFDEMLLGEWWINDYAGISGYENYLGLYEITEIDGSRVRVSFQQMESTALPVPEPGTLALFVIGLAGMRFVKLRD